MEIFDMHCDTILTAYEQQRSLADLPKGQLDLPRMLAGGIKLQFFAIFPDLDRTTQGTLHRTLQLLAYFQEQHQVNLSSIEWIRSLSDLEHCLQSDHCGALLTVEGGEALEGDLRMLTLLYHLGVRSLCLTWNHRNQLADGLAESETNGGLTHFGKEVVQEMNRLGMLVDVSHLSERGFWDVLEISVVPVLATHANCRSVWDHRRNLSDEQIRALAASGGIIGVNCVPQFVGPEGAGIEQLVDHLDQICSLVGVDYAGFGSDFDGTEQLITGVTDASSYPLVLDAMRRRGYCDESIQKICSGNCLRVLRQVLH